MIRDEDNRQRVIIESGGRFAPVPGAEDRAVTVSLEPALRYCAWAGKALTSEAQWEYAAGHDPRTGRDLKYPWGDRFEPNRSWVPPDLGSFERGDALPAGTFDGTGGRGDGSSPWGVHDMASNVHEQVIRCATPDTAGGLYSQCASDARGWVDGVRFDLTMRAIEHPPGTAGVGNFRCVRPAP